MYKITRQFVISSSHQLWDSSISAEENKEIFGKCSNPPSHGHNYIIDVTLKSNELKHGMVRNFSEVKKIFLEKIDKVYDHQFLNNLIPGLTTAENMAKLFYELMKIQFPEVCSVKVYETPTSSAEYSEDD